MSSQPDAPAATAGRFARLRRLFAGKGAACLVLRLGIMGLLSLAGCGYGFSGGQSTVLDVETTAQLSGPVYARPDTPLRMHTLRIKSVEHPTLYPWLGQAIRSNLRDEISARQIAAWADEGNADYQIQIIVHSFTLRTAVHDARDVSLLYTAAIRLTGIVYDSAGKEVWRSTRLSYSDTYDTYNERNAAESLSSQIIKLLVSEMRNTF
ncbi:MAG: LPS assembly lipoprotein LptE [Deltaproteobacteria bacterium]|jgi:hypothetical protein|nr:LPS assembly lipoprotein LptE [Deltaproteobacteria bacterium]